MGFDVESTFEPFDDNAAAGKKGLKEMGEMSNDEEPTRGDVEAAAARFLARRDHARVELAQKLERHDFPDELVEEVLDSLEEFGYLDDERFALVQGGILARKCWGPRQIAQKLRSRGVDDSIIDEALAEIGREEDWRERALQRMISRFGHPRELNESERQKAFRHLTYRGYSGNLIRRLLFDS